MRIIAGTARGRRLLSPEGQSVRPTGDRAKGAVFSILGHRIQGSRVLDLFAGSGALGLEALSRGAESVVAVESDRAAQAVIVKNADALGVEERYELLRGDSLAALDRLYEAGRTFDIVLLDPPYAFERTIEALEKCARVAAVDSVVVLESGEALREAPMGLTISDSRRYGREYITFMKPENRD